MQSIHKLMNERALLWERLRAARAAYEAYLSDSSQHDLTDEVTGEYAEAKQAMEKFDDKINKLLGV